MVVKIIRVKEDDIEFMLDDSSSRNFQLICSGRVLVAWGQERRRAEETGVGSDGQIRNRGCADGCTGVCLVNCILCGKFIVLNS